MRRVVCGARACGLLIILVTACMTAVDSSSPRGAPPPGLVPNPIVTGPIPATAAPGDRSHRYPFFSTPVDLASRGYVEEEFFFERTANAYNISSPLATGSVIPGSSQPYRTRMIVRRPRSRKQFNGTVIMEWQNVSAGFDLDALWVASHEHFLRRGYAWIGVSAQRVGVHAPVTGLKAWSPNRYGGLNVPDDALSFDIFSQAVQAVRHPAGVDPMGGLPVQRVVAGGVSQAATFLVTYHNSIHPLAHIIDGFFFALGGGAVRTDLDVKAFKILSETDVAGNHVAKSQAWIRHPDSDHFRRWEVAGAAHLDFHVAQELAPLQTRENLPKLSGAGCQMPAFSRIPLYFVANAAYDRMVEWVAHNVAPPHGAEIEVASLGEQISVLARDSSGNALGGIRLSQHAVPTATNTGLNLPDLPATNFCRTFGSYVPFDAAKLAVLYPNHAAYLSRVKKLTHENAKHGFVVAEDAKATIQTADRSDIGRN
jgi:alpha/beta hydrolase family protein